MSRRTKKDTGVYRSGFEAKLAAKLESEGVAFSYETETFKIVRNVVGARCFDCLSKKIVKPSRYTPDFFFKNWIVEAKGRFTAGDRKRVLALLQTFAVDHEKRRFAMLFMYDNKISKNSKTRYSDWCEENGVDYAFGYFKKEWLK